MIKSRCERRRERETIKGRGGERKVFGKLKTWTWATDCALTDSGERWDVVGMGK